MPGGGQGRTAPLGQYSWSISGKQGKLISETSTLDNGLQKSPLCSWSQELMLGLLATRQDSGRTQNGDNAEDDLGQVEWGHVPQGEGRTGQTESRDTPRQTNQCLSLVLPSHQQHSFGSFWWTCSSTFPEPAMTPGHIPLICGS